MTYIGPTTVGYKSVVFSAVKKISNGFCPFSKNIEMPETRRSQINQCSFSINQNEILSRNIRARVLVICLNVSVMKLKYLKWESSPISVFIYVISPFSEHQQLKPASFKR